MTASVPVRREGAKVELRSLTKAFAGFRAVDGLSLDIPAGSFVSLLGPSGSGKTTTLNLIAGFLHPDAGDILFDGQPVASVPSHKRNIGMVFQSYALFPHMTVRENVGFPLRVRTRLRGAQAQSRVFDMLALMGLSDLAQRYPRELSGGQQQRVAMARALVSSPRLLLMDEPLGALDKKLREQMQIEIKRIHRTVGTTIVYVTHDQSEALTMSDVVVVMHQSRVAQAGPPPLLYDAPANVFVANFLGESNLVPVKMRETGGEWNVVETADGRPLRVARHAGAPAVGAAAALLIRPEHITVMRQGGDAPDDQTVSGAVSDISYHGDSYRLSVSVGGVIIRANVPCAHAAEFERGQTVTLSWRAEAARLLPDDEPGRLRNAGET